MLSERGRTEKNTHGLLPSQEMLRTGKCMETEGGLGVVARGQGDRPTAMGTGIVWGDKNVQN